MGVTTDADNRLDSADEHIKQAIDSLYDVVFEKCCGAKDYKTEYLEVIGKAMRKLQKIRSKLNRGD